MTQEQRDWGKVISVAVLAGILLMAALAGCTPYMYKSNQIKVTHVLAVTETGDTVKVAMRDIQPTKIYNVVGYDFVRGYNNPYGKIQNINPTVLPNNIGSGSNTTGGAGAPVATNPVTATGGGKKNN